MVALILSAFVFGQPAPASPIGLCDPVDGPRVEFTAAHREEVQARARRTCDAIGASGTVCDWIDTVVYRESRGRSSVRHTRAEGENGLGPMGLSLKWHAGKWTGNADPDFCTPEVSVVVAFAIAWIAVTRYHAESVLDIQAVYSGRTGHYIRPNGRKWYYADPNDHTQAITCPGMKKRGSSCNTPVSRKDLGQRLAKRDRAAFVEGLL